jgi:5-oxoprolinase (ATP-hydrolysing) subunit A
VRRIDLNADVGEDEGPDGLARDAALISLVTSVNIACGAHAGTVSTMRQTVRLALARGVAIGAHPGLADRPGFGRREQAISQDDARRLVHSQLERLAAICAEEGARVTHVKPHGALYNMAARDRPLADAIVQAVRSFDPTLRLVGLAGSSLIAAGLQAGLDVAAEGFVDRRYEPDGRLASRSIEGAVLSEPNDVMDQALSIALYRIVKTSDGSTKALAVDTLCIHSDTPGAVNLARLLRAQLAAAGVVIAPL